jgi:hypothetical protein
LAGRRGRYTLALDERELVTLAGQDTSSPRSEDKGRWLLVSAWLIQGFTVIGQPVQVERQVADNRYVHGEVARFRPRTF